MKCSYWACINQIQLTSTKYCKSLIHITSTICPLFLARSFSQGHCSGTSLPKVFEREVSPTQNLAWSRLSNWWCWRWHEDLHQSNNRDLAQSVPTCAHAVVIFVLDFCHSPKLLVKGRHWTTLSQRPVWPVCRERPLAGKDMQSYLYVCLCLHILLKSSLSSD